MNLVQGLTPVPLRVLMVNPLSPASQIICMKILSGSIFGKDELIDLILLVYLNEVEAAEALKMALDACAYSTTNSITVTSLLPNVADADIFCFISNFPNPNFIDFDLFDKEASFDSFYLLLKVAHNFSQQTPPVEKPEDDTLPIKKRKFKVKRNLKPIFMTDGLVPLDILSSFSKNIPADVLYCPTSLSVIAKSVLGEYLKVNCDVINDVLVWAANDYVFHVDIRKPCLIYDTVTSSQKSCTWFRMGKDVMESLNVDHTQFNASWLKKEYIEMIKDVMSRHPYGNICKASEFGKALRDIWSFRTNANINNDSNKNKKIIFDNFGVISDGSLGTIKGYPYVLPLFFTGDMWEVDNRFDDTSFLKNEIKRMNKAVKEHHTKLLKYCRKFLDDNVINQDFVPKDDESSVFSVDMTTTSPRITSEPTGTSSRFTSFSVAPNPKETTPRAYFNVSRSSDSFQ